jgi:putative DNA primase/helicase
MNEITFPQLQDEQQTDVANSERFVGTYKSKILFVPAWKKWLAWDGRRWLDDNGVSVLKLGKRYAKSLWDTFAAAAASSASRDELLAFRTFCKRTNQRAKIADFIALATADERVVCHSNELNRDPYRLNCLNGTLDLRTGELARHNPADRITQLAVVEYHPKADCPEWLAALKLIFDGDGHLINYFQQLCGYMLSGLTDAHLMPIAYGAGCNGKSTVTNVLLALLGDYGHTANQDLILPTKQNPHPAEKAQLYQKRFVAISEPSQGRWLDEAKLKSLTGGDEVNCRGMGENFWTFTPTHKFWLSTNHKPKIRGTDEGIWRRVRLIPFTVDIRSKTEPRKGIAEWLVANEGPGILAWAVRGFRDWMEFGFAEPPAVTNATAGYRAAEDELGQWLADNCLTEEGAEERADRLYRAYTATGGRMSQKAFGDQLSERFEKLKPTAGPNRNKVVYHGLRLADEGAVF